jgi:hypothetical protein
MITKDEFLEVISVSAYTLGIFAVSIGGVALVTSATSTALISVGRALESQRPAIHKLMVFSCASDSGGVLMVVGGLVIARLRKSPTPNTPPPIKPQLLIPIACRNCKYFSGEMLLPCAVHPELKENCSDREPS